MPPNIDNCQLSHLIHPPVLLITAKFNFEQLYVILNGAKG